MPPKLPPSLAGSGPHLMHCWLGTPESISEYDISISSAVSVEFTVVTNRQTDRQTQATDHRNRNVRRILVRGANAPLPPEAKKILKI